MTETLRWGGLYRGPLTQLAEFERTTGKNVIPAGTPMLIYETVSWWRNPLKQAPRIKHWPNVQPGSVAFFAFETGSKAAVSFAHWGQPDHRFAA